MIRRVKSYEDILKLAYIQGAGGWLTTKPSNWQFAPDMALLCGKVIEIEDKANDIGVRNGLDNAWKWAEEWLEPINENIMEFKINKDAILKAAATSPQAKAALEALCPKAFEPVVGLAGGEIRTQESTLVLATSVERGLKDDHIWLNTENYTFQIVTAGRDNTYLKVTNK